MCGATWTYGAFDINKNLTNFALKEEIVVGGLHELCLSVPQGGNQDALASKYTVSGKNS